MKRLILFEWLFLCLLFQQSLCQRIEEPHLSLNARALSPDEALVTWSFIGELDVTDLRLSIATSPITTWNTFEPGREHAEFRLQGLEPRTFYFIKLEVQINNGDDVISALTHIKTPPYGSQAPRGITVKKMADGKIKVAWSQSAQNGIIGYLISYTELDANDKAKGVTQIEPVFGTTKSFVVGDVKPYSRYRFRVSALTRYGEGLKSDPVFIGEKLSRNSKIVMAPKHHKVVEGSTVTFVCKAIADPMPNIVWRKSGKKLTSNMKDISIVNQNGVSVLTITNVTTKRKGPYVCIAGNKVGKRAKAKGVLLVHKQKAVPPGYPSITTDKQTHTTTAGSSVTLQCSADGKEPVHITWYRNSLPIHLTENTRFTVTENGDLRLTNIEKSDEANYQCSAENQLGFVLSEKHVIHVKGFPDKIKTITTPRTRSKTTTTAASTTTKTTAAVPFGPDSVTITGLESPRRRGDKISLACVTSPSHPAASVSWTVKGRKIEDAVNTVETSPQGGTVTTSRLEIKVTDRDENTTYTCEVVNAESHVTRYSSVIVKVHGSGKQRIISIPPAITIANRLTPTTAIVEWLPATDMLRFIQAFKIYYTPLQSNGTQDEANVFTETLDKDVWQHSISTLNPNVTYKVEVTLTTAEGEGPRSVARILHSLIQDEQISFTSSPQPLKVKEHGSAIFTCSATGNPLSALYWQHNDAAVNLAEGRYKMWLRDGSTVLRIDDVKTADAGFITCVAKNDNLGLVVRKSASLSVYSESETPSGFPRITKYPEMIKRPGRSYLKCDVVSDWPFNITWYKNSYPINRNGRVFQKMGRLHFANLTKDDEGNYQCSVTNKFGTTFSRVSEVLVKSSRDVNEPKPQIKEVRVAPGSNINLTCLGVGSPAPKVKWQYRGQDLETGGSTVLQLIDVQQSRNYTCVAIGYGGRTFATFAIIVERNATAVKVKPVIVADTARVIVRHGKDANLTCSAREQSVLYFNWLRNGKLVYRDNAGANSSRSVLHVPRVTETSNYTCVAVGAGVTTEAVFKVIALNVEGPTIILPPKTQKVKEGKSVRFFCEAVGAEPVEVTWQTDENTNLPRHQHLSMDVGGNDVHQLVVHSVKPKNSGTVYCVATDADGKTTTAEAKLEVYAYGDVPRGYPKFSKHPITKTSELGTSVDFNCESEGNPPPEITWYKDEFPLEKSTNNRIVMYKGRLVIDDLKTTDVGSYHCAAVNEFGTTFSKASELTVTARRFVPQFTSASDPVIVTRGASVNLTCTADGFPLPFVKWMVNNIDIDKNNIPKGGNVLLIRNVQSSGNYTCVAYNSLGEIRTNFEVKMRSPPKLVNLPVLAPHVKRIRVTRGSYVNLTCIGSGSSHPAYNWKADGVDLTDQHDAILTLRNVQVTKNYTCLAVSGSGTSQATFEVIVEDAEGPLIIKPPTDKKVEEGSQVKFHCRAAGEPSPTIFWEINGQRVDERIHDRYKVSVRTSESVLDIEPVKYKRDEGVVTCVADNGRGLLSRNSAHLDIYEGTTVPNNFPVITEHPKLRVVKRGHDAFFYCEALGVADAVIEWYMDGFPVQQSDKYDLLHDEVDSSELVVMNADKYDEGSYQCSVENEIGIVYSYKSSLYVRETRIPPSITRVSKNPDVSKGSNIELTCQAIGVPMPEISWQKNGREIKENQPRFGSNTLYIENIQKSQSFTCIATNDHGKVTSDVFVNVYGVEALPTQPENVRVSNISTNDATIIWEESTSPTDHPVISYIIQLKKCEPGAKFGSDQEVIVDPLTRKYKIRDLTPSQCYKVQVLAVNTLGRSRISEKNSRQFNTQQDEFHNPPQNVSVRQLTDSSIMVSWEPPRGNLDYLTEYQILFTKNPNIPLFAWDKRTVQKNQTIATINELNEQAVYYVIVQSVHRDEEIRSSGMVEITLATEGQKDPSLITNLYAEVVSPTSIRLSWQNPDLDLPITGYGLYIDDSDDNFEKYPLDGHRDSYVLEGLYPGADYKIKIAPVTAYGEGPTSALISVRLPSFVLEAPEVEKITAVNSTAVMVKWSEPSPQNDPENVNPIVGYVVYTERVTPDETGARNIQRVQIDGSRHQFVISNLQPATEYRVWIASVTRQGDGPSSDPEVVITASEDSKTPRIDSVTPKNDTAILVKWKPPLARDSRKIRGYFVYVEKIRSGPWDPTVRYIMDVRPGNQRSVVMGNLLPGHEYRVEVAAYGADGEGPRSNPQIVRTTGAAAVTPLPDTVPKAPLLDDVSVLNSTAITVVWQPPKEQTAGLIITGYYIYVEKYQGGRWEAESRYYTAIPPTGQIFVINKMDPDMKYRISVTAISADGEGPPSESKVVVMDEEFENEDEDEDFNPTLIPEAPVLEEVTPVNTSSLLLKWRPSARDSLPEKQITIRGFYLYVEKYSHGRWISEFKFETNALSNRQQIVINGLQAGKKYKISVAAFSSVGEGPKSEPKAAETFRSEADIRSRKESNSESGRQESGGFCQLYLGTACSRFLRNKTVFMSSRFEQQAIEPKVRRAVRVIENTVSQRCQNFLMAAICFHSFPPCIAIGNRPRPRQICQPDCFNLHSVCKEDALLSKRHRAIAPVFPVCKDLAEPGKPAADNCVRISASSGQRKTGQQSRGSAGTLTPSAPQTLAVNPISRAPFRVRISWRPPQRPNGDLQSYSLRWTSDEGSFESEVSAEQTSLETEDLSRGMMYVFEVRARNQNGLSEPTIVRFNIPDGVPTGHPQNFTARALSPSSVMLSWLPPLKEQQNGRIRRYQGLYYLVSNPDLYQHFATESQNFTLVGLRRRTQYAAQVQALTKVGRGPWTSKLTFTTP